MRVVIYPHFFMALQPYSFVTVADMKSMLDISETTWDSILEDLIDQCTKWCENYCGGRRFLQSGSDVTEYYDGKDSCKIFLKNYPIISITSVSYRSGFYDNPDWIAFNPSYEYLRDDVKGILHMAAMPRGIQNIKVVYKGGYSSAANVPDDLHLAVRKMVAKEFNRRKSQGILQESLGGSSVTWNENLDPFVSSLLDNYKNFV